MCTVKIQYFSYLITIHLTEPPILVFHSKILSRIWITPSTPNSKPPHTYPKDSTHSSRCPSLWPALKYLSPRCSQCIFRTTFIPSKHFKKTQALMESTITPNSKTKCLKPFTMASNSKRATRNSVLKVWLKLNCEILCSKNKKRSSILPLHHLHKLLYNSTTTPMDSGLQVCALSVKT